MSTIYDEVFKQQAVELVLSGGHTQAQVADDLGVNRKTLNNWVFKARKAMQKE